MAELIKAKEPFRFYTRLHLTELTGLRACNLSQLSGLLKEAPDSCVYYHTHRFLQQYQYLFPGPPNDFAYWVSEILGEDKLGERLSSIDIIQFSSLGELREKFVTTIEDYLNDFPVAKLKFCGEEEVFHFMKSVSFVIPTNFTASNLVEFREVLNKITLESIYFHIFEARLRFKKPTNDFSHWIDTSLGDKELAGSISKLDPYAYTLNDLRIALVHLVENRILN
ncbi:MAG: DUF5752 family protein [Candidatus Omnitrophota bacterium]|jgi:hypothetical protein